MCMCMFMCVSVCVCALERKVGPGCLGHVYVGRVWRAERLVIIAGRAQKAGITGLSEGWLSLFARWGCTPIYINTQAEWRSLTHAHSAFCIGRVYCELSTHVAHAAAASFEVRIMSSERFFLCRDSSCVTPSLGGRARGWGPTYWRNSMTGLQTHAQLVGECLFSCRSDDRTAEKTFRVFSVALPSY